MAPSWNRRLLNGSELKEWMKPVDVVVPKSPSGRADILPKVYREPYGVTLVIGPFKWAI